MAMGVGSLSGRSSVAAAGHHVERFLPNAGDTTAPPSRNASVAPIAPWMTAMVPDRKRRLAGSGVGRSGDGHIDGSGFRVPWFRVRFRVQGSVHGSSFRVRSRALFEAFGSRSGEDRTPVNEPEPGTQNRTLNLEPNPA